MGKTGHQRAASTGAGLAMGLGASLLLTVIVLTITAKLIQKEMIPEESVGYGIMISLLLGSFGGAVTGAMMIQRRKGIICLSAGALYWAALIAITALFFGGQYQSVGVTGVLILAGAGAAALLTVKEKRRNKRKMK